MMRTHRWATHLQPEEALTLIECLDQLRAVLLQSYAEDIRRMLQEATPARTGSPRQLDLWPEDIPPF